MGWLLQKLLTEERPQCINEEKPSGITTEKIELKKNVM